MKRVNLSRRPFVNRRPVVRLGVALWVLGGLLVLVNLWLFNTYWSDSQDVRAELEMVNGEVAAELEALQELDRKVDRINLAAQNSQAAYLNSLISYRTFPWSALFDDLERVLPRDVRLEAVSPAVRLAAAELAQKVQRAAQQERSDARRGRSRRNSREPSPAQTVDQELGSDEVQLQLRGTAKQEDALIEFVDTLYRDASFRKPVLSGESFESVGGVLTSSFEISVIYLTRGSKGSEAASPEEIPSEPKVAEGAVAPRAGISSEGSAADPGSPSGPKTLAETVAASTPPPPTPPTVQGKSFVAPKPPPVSVPRAETAPPRQRAQPVSQPKRDENVSRESPGAGAPSSEPSASEKAAAERKRRIDELRQRRREALRRNRVGAVGGRQANAGASEDARGRSTEPQDGSTGPDRDTARRETSRDDTGRGRDGNGTASETPRIRGSLVPGLPEMLEGWLSSPPSPLAEPLEDLVHLSKNTLVFEPRDIHVRGVTLAATEPPYASLASLADAAPRGSRNVIVFPKRCA